MEWVGDHGDRDTDELRPVHAMDGLPMATPAGINLVRSQKMAQGLASEVPILPRLCIGRYVVMRMKSDGVTAGSGSFTVSLGGTALKNVFRIRSHYY